MPLGSQFLNMHSIIAFNHIQIQLPVMEAITERMHENKIDIIFIFISVTFFQILSLVLGLSGYNQMISNK